MTVAECVDRLIAADIPVGPVLALDEVFADPQVQHLAVHESRAGVDGAPVALLRHPVTMAGTPMGIGDGPRPAGADTEVVLGEVGVGAEEIAAWVASGGVGVAADWARWLE